MTLAECCLFVDVQFIRGVSWDGGLVEMAIGRDCGLPCDAWRKEVTGSISIYDGNSIRQAKRILFGLTWQHKAVLYLLLPWVFF